MATIETKYPTLNRTLYIDFQTGEWSEAPASPKPLLPNYSEPNYVVQVKRHTHEAWNIILFNLPQRPWTVGDQAQFILRAKRHNRMDDNLVLFGTSRIFDLPAVASDGIMNLNWFSNDVMLFVTIGTAELDAIFNTNGATSKSLPSVDLDFEVRLVVNDATYGNVNILISLPATLRVDNDLKRDNDSHDAPVNQGYPEASTVATTANIGRFVDAYLATKNIVTTVGGQTGDIAVGTNLSMSGKTLNATGGGGGVTSIGGQSGDITIGTNLSMSGKTLNASGGGGVTSIGGQTGEIQVGFGSGMTMVNNILTNTGVHSFGGQAGDIQVGTNLTMAGKTLNASGGGGGGVTSIGGKTGAIVIGNGLGFDASGSLENTGLISLDNKRGALTLREGLSMNGQALQNDGIKEVVYINPIGEKITSKGTFGRIYIETMTNGLALTPHPCGVALISNGVRSLGGASGVIALGTNLTMSGNTLNASGGGGGGVTSIGGQTGAITLGDNLFMSGQQMQVSSMVNSFGGMTGVIEIADRNISGLYMEGNGLRNGGIRDIRYNPSSGESISVATQANGYLYVETRPEGVSLYKDPSSTEVRLAYKGIRDIQQIVQQGSSTTVISVARDATGGILIIQADKGLALTPSSTEVILLNNGVTSIAGVKGPLQLGNGLGISSVGQGIIESKFDIIQPTSGAPYSLMANGGVLTIGGGLSMATEAGKPTLKTRV